jgi:hypothetical protein
VPYIFFVVEHRSHFLSKRSAPQAPSQGTATTRDRRCILSRADIMVEHPGNLAASSTPVSAGEEAIGVLSVRILLYHTPAPLRTVLVGKLASR